MESLEKRTFGSCVAKLLKNKAFVMLCLISAVFVVPTFAGDDTIGKLDEWSAKVLDIFASKWLKAVCLIALVLEALGVVVGGQQGGGGQLIKKFAPWMIGTVIMLCASSICSYFLTDIEFTTSYVQPSQTIENANHKAIADIPVSDAFLGQVFQES